MVTQPENVMCNFCVCSAMFHTSFVLLYFLLKFCGFHKIRHSPLKLFAYVRIWYIFYPPKIFIWAYYGLWLFLNTRLSSKD